MAANTTARVYLWGRLVGAVTWLDARRHAVFEFEPEFRASGLDVAPLRMPLARATAPFRFPGLGEETFLGLPGLLADALPDKFGNAVIDAWLARQGRDHGSFDPVERLCYVGRRGMGALEFQPAVGGKLEDCVPVEVAALRDLAQEITRQRQRLATRISGDHARDTDALLDIMRVGSSAGGARPKAVIAMNDEGDVRSGQVTAPEGYDYWILKFDGVEDLELGKPGGYGRIEFAYHKMATAAGIRMTECRLLQEGGRAHFLAKRFDRGPRGSKIHMQSLCAIAHLDFNMAGAHSYEEAFSVMRELRLSKAEVEEQFRRMVFNVVARNQDDHTKNIAFLMDEDGSWRLSPAFDVIYAHNPRGQWTDQHQMTIAGKRDGFELRDLVELGQAISLPKPQRVIEEVVEAVRRWAEFAAETGVPAERSAAIAKTYRMLM